MTGTRRLPLVPTVLRGNAVFDASRRLHQVSPSAATAPQEMPTRSVEDGIPTQSVGTSVRGGNVVGHAERGAWERGCTPASRTGTALALALALAIAWLAANSSTALAEGSPPTASIPRPDSRAKLPPRPGHAPTYSDPGGGWWLVPAGIAAALAVFGGVSLASKRFAPTRDSASIRVIGRSSLSTKHSACLLRVGDRVLIVGIGPQGPPSTLGEVTDPVELARLVPRREPRPIPEPKAAQPRPSAGFDRRIGDDE